MADYDYIFELVIDEMDNRGLFLEKAGKKEFTPAIIQDFGECWGVQDSVHERRIFDFWKDSFFPMLLKKYNIDKKDCMVRFQGPKEMHDFFLQEGYKGVFEPVGGPIKRIEESELWKKFDLESQSQFRMENGTSLIKLYNDTYIPKKKKELSCIEENIKEIDGELSSKNEHKKQIENGIKDIQKRQREAEKEKKEKEKSLVNELETIYRSFSSRINNESSQIKSATKRYELLYDEIKQKFNVSSIRNNIFQSLSEADKKILNSFFITSNLSNCVGTAINSALIKGRERGFLKKNKYYEGSFDVLKFNKVLNEKINEIIGVQTNKLKNDMQQSLDKKLNLLNKELENKNNELNKVNEEINELNKSINALNVEKKKLESNLNSKQNKVRALNAR